MDLATKVYQQNAAAGNTEAPNDNADSNKNSDVEEANYEEK